MQYVAVCCSVLHRVAVCTDQQPDGISELPCCSLLRCVAACCSVLQRVAMFAVCTDQQPDGAGELESYFLAPRLIGSLLACVAVCRSVLQCVAVS